MNDSQGYLCPLNIEENDQALKVLHTDYPCEWSNFSKSSSFSPDGYSLLCTTEQHHALVYSLNNYIINSSAYYSGFLGKDSNDSENTLALSSAIHLGEAIYDVKWYPQLQSDCFLSATRDHPLQLWDVNAGCVRCSYRGYNHVDELDNAVSIAFNMNGEKIYAGYNRMIRCFDAARPGRECIETPTSATKRSSDGQKGLISALCFNPDYSGAYAAGSYAHSVGIYVENSNECVLLLSNLNSGVTCLRWSPCGRYLWIGGRKDSTISCWDIRQSQTMVGTVPRPLHRNQRILFDVDPWGKYLCTGDQEGHLLFYDCSSCELVSSVAYEDVPHLVVQDDDDDEEEEEEGECSELQHKQQASLKNKNKNKSTTVKGGQCVNSVAFHPFSSVLGISIGERVFPSFDYDNDDDDDEEEEEEEDIAAVGYGVAGGITNEDFSCEGDGDGCDTTSTQRPRKRPRLYTDSGINNNENNTTVLQGSNTSSCSSNISKDGLSNLMTSIQLWRMNYTPIKLSDGTAK